MTSRLTDLVAQGDLNYFLTNVLLPRKALTQFMGWFAKIERPIIRDLSIAVWRQFTHVALDEAKKRPAEFKSLHDCFIRELKDGARTVDADPAILASPCDAIVGALGQVEGNQLNQSIKAKGLTYTLEELLGDPELAALYRNGRYVTLRLTSAMYHRFHAPHDCRVEQVTYVPGDTWNTNPSTVGRVDRLFVKNERAIVRARLAGGALVTLVPVASIIVASLRFHFVDLLLHLGYRGPHVIPCDAKLAKGQEMGWFELGSTIIVFAPEGFSLCEGIAQGQTIRMGQALMRVPPG